MPFVVVRINPATNEYGILAHALSDRVRLYAQEHQPEYRSDEYTRVALSRLWIGDPAIAAYGIVDTDNSLLVGHVLAERIMSGSVSLGSIPQMKADLNVGDALQVALQAAEDWLKQPSASYPASEAVILNPHRDFKTWEKRGAQLVRHVLVKPL